jgi:uncharacterized protein
MTRYFLDTSFLVSLEIESDQNHQRAIKIWNEVTKAPFHFVCTSYILDELVTYLNSRGFHRKAVEAGENLLLSPNVDLVHIDESRFFEAWDLFCMYEDKRFSLTDCSSFVLMRSEGLNVALSFDADFEQAGFLVNVI